MDKNICVLPWIHMHINHSGEVYPCCRNKQTDSYGNIKSQNIESIWNNTPIQKIRKSFLDGVTPSSCLDCVQTEKLGGRSLRQLSNELFSESLLKIEGPLNKNLPVSLDVRFSNVCNLRCRTCEPHNSTSWYAESELIYNKPPPEGILVPGSLHKILDLVTPELKYIHFLGGEPLLHDEHYEFLEKLIEINRTDIKLSYNTNMTRLRHKNWNPLNLWKHFKSVDVSASLDGAGIHSDLLRKGSKWQDIVTNFRLIRLFGPHINFGVFPAISVLNCFHITEALKVWLELGMVAARSEVRFNYVEGPDFYCAKILDLNERARLILHYRDFLAEIKATTLPAVYKNIEEELFRFYGWLGTDVWHSKRGSFREATLKLDASRGENFTMAFPELSSLVN